MIRRVVKAAARYILKDEIARLRGEIRFTELCFTQWRKSAWLWERYARELQARHPGEVPFEKFFYGLPPEERRNPKPQNTN